MTVSPSKALSWTVPVLGAVMLALTLSPAELWNAPVNDGDYAGFDRNLVYVDPGGSGAVDVSRDAILITARPSSQPSVNLLTTLLRKVSVSVDVVIVENRGALVPLRIGVWSPSTSTGQFVAFGPGPLNPITSETVTHGGISSTLVGGNIVNQTILGHYQPGNTYHVSMVIDRVNGVIVSTVSDAQGGSGESSVTSRQFPAIFGNVHLSLSASAVAGASASAAVLRNYRLTIPHQRSYVFKVADGRMTFILGLLVALGTLVLGLELYIRLAPSVLALPRAHHLNALAGLTRRATANPIVLFASILTLVLYVVGNALLFRLGSHPFDMGNETFYAYVSSTDGTAQLYYLMNVVPLAKTLAGVPYIDAAFPYQPGMAYFFSGIGWLYSNLFAAGGSFRPDAVSLEYVIKAVNVLFGLADSVLIYLIVRQLREVQRWSLIAGALFLFNPAVWFSTSVWGQTHVFSIFFTLVSVLLAEKRRPMLAWLALAGAVLTRPQMVVFGILLGIVLLRKFSWRQNLMAASWAIVITFIALAPLAFATSPTLPVDVMLNNLRVQEGGGNEVALTTVSQDAYSVWPLVTYLVHGSSGLQRAFTPSSELLVGSLTYQRVSQILTVAAMLIVVAVLIRGRATIDGGGYLAVVALGITSFLMLLTGVVATHFLLALPFLLLCRRWLGSATYFYVSAIWTITTLVPMFGDMGVAISSQSHPLLASTNNTVTRFFVGLYSWDRFITVAIVANICAVVWIAFATFRAQYSLGPRSAGT